MKSNSKVKNRPRGKKTNFCALQKTHEALLHKLPAAGLEFSRTKRMMYTLRKYNMPLRRTLMWLVSYYAPVRKEVTTSVPVEEKPFYIDLSRTAPISNPIVDFVVEHMADVQVELAKRPNSYFRPPLVRTLCFILDTPRPQMETVYTDAEIKLCVKYNDKMYEFKTLDLRQISQWVADLTEYGIEPNPGPRGKRVNKNKKRGKPRNTSFTRQPNTVRYNSIMPYNKKATLHYLDGSTIRNNPGGSFLVYSMRINDLYDPDPAILSGSVSNFKEMMQFYSYYRVLKTSIDWTVVNLEAFPLSCGIVFSQTNLTGVISSLADCQNAMENDFVVPLRTISGAQGINRTEFHCNNLDLSRLLGAGRQYKAEGNYTGLGLATPAIPLWANFIVFAPTSASLALGYTNNTTLHFQSEFFGRLNVRA